MDERFDLRLEEFLDAAAESGEYVMATPEDFDAMEREALDLLATRTSR